MIPWNNRPIEEAHLLNPAFGCVVMTAAIFGFQTVQPVGVPFPLAFTIFPIVLHKTTRDLLPTTTRTPMAFWLQENAEVKVQFSERVLALKPHTREAILFGTNQQWIVLNGANLTCNLNRSALDKATKKLTDEAKECTNKAQIIGKWFANVGSTETSMHLWGIRP